MASAHGRICARFGMPGCLPLPSVASPQSRVAPRRRLLRALRATKRSALGPVPAARERARAQSLRLPSRNPAPRRARHRVFLRARHRARLQPRLRNHQMHRRIQNHPLNHRPKAPSPTDSPLTSNDDVDDYIVVVRNEAYIDSIKSKAEDLGGESDKELRGAVDGFTAALTPLDVNELRADPNVRYIEPDALIELDSATFEQSQRRPPATSAVAMTAVHPRCLWASPWTGSARSTPTFSSTPTAARSSMTVADTYAVTGTSTSAPPPGPTSSPCSPT